MIKIARSWRISYIKRTEDTVELGRQIDHVLMKKPVDVPKVEQLVRERARLVTEMELEFVRRWADWENVFTPSQSQKLEEIYRNEFRKIPHPVLGTQAFEPVLPV